MSTTSTRVTEIGSVMLPVADQDAAITFYTDVLGLEKRADVPFGEGNRWVEVAPHGAQTAIALVPSHDPDGTPNPPATIGLLCDDVDAAHADLRERGLAPDDVMRMGGPVPPMFHVQDPDGNNIWIVERGS